MPTINGKKQKFTKNPSFAFRVMRLHSINCEANLIKIFVGDLLHPADLLPEEGVHGHEAAHPAHGGLHLMGRVVSEQSVMMSNLKIQCREKSFVNKHPTYG
jgi:hypothetical protein